MKKLFVISSVIFIFLFCSCGFPTAKCLIISQQAMVVVDHGDLRNFEEGDTIFLEKIERDRYEDWEVATGNIYSKDTTFTFNSQAGPYQIHVVKAVIKKKL